MSTAFTEYDRDTMVLAFNYMYLNAFCEDMKEKFRHCVVTQFINVAVLLNSRNDDEHSDKCIPLALLAKLVLRQTTDSKTVWFFYT